MPKYRIKINQFAVEILIPGLRKTASLYFRTPEKHSGKTGILKANPYEQKLAE